MVEEPLVQRIQEAKIAFMDAQEEWQGQTRADVATLKMLDSAFNTLELAWENAVKYAREVSI